MKQLNDRTKELLRETKDFIAVNDFLAAYDYYYKHCDSGQEVADCTLAFLAAGINPLRYMVEVPTCYLCDEEYPGLIVTIPSKVETIENYAFSASTIGALIIEGTIQKVSEGWYFAFLDFDGKIKCNEETQDTILKASNHTRDASYRTSIRWEIV